MFAFAIWDRPRQRLLLARDRLGIKPLYYARHRRRAAVRLGDQGAAGGGRPCAPAFNEAVLPEFLATRFVSGEETFFRGVRKLLPGHVLTWSPGEPPRHAPLLAAAGPGADGRRRRAVGARSARAARSGGDAAT